MVAHKEGDKPRRISTAEILRTLMNPVRRLIEAFSRLVDSLRLSFYADAHCSFNHVGNQRTRMGMARRGFIRRIPDIDNEGG